MPAAGAGTRAQDAPSGVVVQDALLAAARTGLLGGLLGPPSPAAAAVAPVQIADRGAAVDTVTLPLAHPDPRPRGVCERVGAPSQRRHRPAPRRGRTSGRTT